MVNVADIAARTEGVGRTAAKDVWEWTRLSPAEIDLSTLSAADRQTASRYGLTWQRRQFLCTRALLRLALSEMSGARTGERDWRFEYDSGKPRVARGLAPIHFSVSHNEVSLIVAVSTGGPVGVDVELFNQPIGDNLIENFCSVRERARLSRMAEEDRRRNFLVLWTLKEAYAKMTGLGMSVEFSSIDFPGGPLRLESDPRANFLSVSPAIAGRPCQVSLSWRNSTGHGTVLPDSKRIFFTPFDTSDSVSVSAHE